MMPYDEAFASAQMDPFAAMNQMHQRMRQMHESMMGSVMQTMAGFGTPPFGFGGGMGMDLMDPAGMRSPFDTLLEAPPVPHGGGGNFVSMSYSMSSQTGSDGRPVVHEAKQMNVMDERGLYESQYEMRAPEQDRAGLLRGTQEQAVAVEKARQKADGTQHTNTRYRNMQEHELEAFDQNWHAHTETPFWSQTRTMQQRLAEAPTATTSLTGLLTSPQAALPPIPPPGSYIQATPSPSARQFSPQPSSNSRGYRNY